MPVRFRAYCIDLSFVIFLGNGHDKLCFQALVESDSNFLGSIIRHNLREQEPTSGSTLCQPTETKHEHMEHVEYELSPVSFLSSQVIPIVPPLHNTPILHPNRYQMTLPHTPA